MAKQFKKAVSNEAHGSALVDYRETNNPKWCVCVYEDAEVLIPSNWRISATDCPDGLTEGCRYDHWWEPIEDGTYIMVLRQCQ